MLVASFVVGLLAAARDAAAEPAPLDLEACVSLALAAPSSAEIARRQRDIARARADNARAGLLPRIALQAGYVRNSRPLGTSGTSSADPGSFVGLNGIDEYTGVATLTEEIDLSGRLRATLGRAHAEEAAAEASFRISARDLRRAVASAYYRLLLARRLVLVAREALDEATQFAARAELLTQKGEAARADVVKAQLAVEQQRQALAAATLDEALTNQELAAFWTDDLTTPLALVDVLEQAPLPPAAPLRPRAELSLMDAQLRGLDFEARAARAARYPQASLVGEYGLDANRVAWRDRGYALLLNLTVPLFDSGAASSANRALSLQIDQLRVEQRLLTRALAREYQSARVRVEALAAQIAVARAQVDLSAQNLKLSRVRYEGGEGSALEVVSAQAQLAQARTGYYQTLTGHLQARADLAIAAGQ